MLQLIREGVTVFSMVRDEIQFLLDEAQSLDPTYANFAVGQFHFYSERCQSANLLLQYGKLWDCDILMRSAFECATRFLFVSTADGEERTQRVNEYTVLLAEIEHLQRSEKTRTAAEQTIDPDSAMLFGGAVLSPEQLAGLRVKWPKPKRTALNQKWSFSEMARALTGIHREGIDLRLYGSLLHIYAISSHLIHADQTAMNLIWERRSRNIEELSALEAAHAARLVIDPIAILLLCWRGLAFAIGSFEQNKHVLQSFFELEKKANSYQKTFANTQREYYE